MRAWPGTGLRRTDGRRPSARWRMGWVVILSIDAYQRLLEGQRQESWQDLVERARAQIRFDLAERELPSPDEILQQTREERDAQLVDLR
jgi:hypothetical protein